jgi:Fur family zinc uptake transcriptional regulator
MAMELLGFERHDHAECIRDGLRKVERFCADAGLRLTPARRRVLEILLHEHRAMGAYDILDILRRENLGSQPPVAYRALDFLVRHGFAHRIERLNAFIACAHPERAHTPAFLICRACDAVAEGHAEPGMGLMGQAVHETGFAVEQAVIEAVGLCPNCQASAA